MVVRVSKVPSGFVIVTIGCDVFTKVEKLVTNTEMMTELHCVRTNDSSSVSTSRFENDSIYSTKEGKLAALI